MIWKKYVCKVNNCPQQMCPNLPPLNIKTKTKQEAIFPFSIGEKFLQTVSCGLFIFASMI